MSKDYDYKLTKTEAKNLDLLSKVGSVEYKTHWTANSAPLEDPVANQDGFNRAALDSLVNKCLVNRTTLRECSKDYDYSLYRWENPTGSWFSIETTFIIN